MDAAAWLFIIPVLIIGLWVLFSLGLPQDGAPPPGEDAPAPVMVDLGILTLRAEVVMTGVESDFRSRGLIHEAEGARQMRVAIRALLEGVKNERIAQ